MNYIPKILLLFCLFDLHSSLLIWLLYSNLIVQSFFRFTNWTLRFKYRTNSNWIFKQPMDKVKQIQKDLDKFIKEQTEDAYGYMHVNPDDEDEIPWIQSILFSLTFSRFEI